MFANKKSSFIFILIVLISFSTYLFYKYNHYMKKQKSYELPFFSLPLKEYIQNFNKQPQIKLNFETFLKSDKIASDYGIWMKDMNYNIIKLNDTIYIYDFGFDNKDDKLKERYFPKGITFLNSFFKKGDVILSKQNVNNIRNKDSNQLKVWGLDDSIPPPPRPLPKNLLDSIKNWDDARKDKFIKKWDSINEINYLKKNTR